MTKPNITVNVKLHFIIIEGRRMDQGNESKDEYLEFLCSLGLNGLSEESQRLNLARSNLTDAGQELALNHYPSFIATNECMKNLSSDVSVSIFA